MAKCLEYSSRKSTRVVIYVLGRDILAFWRCSRRNCSHPLRFRTYPKQRGGYTDSDGLLIGVLCHNQFLDYN